MKTGVLDSRHWLNSALCRSGCHMLSHIPVRCRAGRASSFLKQSRVLTRGLWDSDRFKKEPVHNCFKKTAVLQATHKQRSSEGRKF